MDRAEPDESGGSPSQAASLAQSSRTPVCTTRSVRCSSHPEPAPLTEHVAESRAHRVSAGNEGGRGGTGDVGMRTRRGGMKRKSNGGEQSFVTESATHESCPSPIRTSAKSLSRRGQRPACGFDACGDTSGWADPCETCPDTPSHARQFLCAACHQPPIIGPAGKEQWTHYATEEIVVEASRFMTESNPEVAEGFSPSTACLCSRTTCFYASFLRWRKARARDNQTKCEVCGTSQTSQWKCPDKLCVEMHEFFSSGAGRHVGEKKLAASGKYLQAGDTICSACWEKFERRNTSVANAQGESSGVLSIEEYRDLLESRDPPERASPEYAETRATILVLIELQDGAMVSRDAAIRHLRANRDELKLPRLTEDRCCEIVSQIFHRISDTVSDAYYASWDGAQLGLDDRLHCEYVVPTTLKAMHIARADQRCKDLIKTNANLRLSHT